MIHDDVYKLTLTYFRTMRFWDHGYVSFWRNKYAPIVPECRVDLPAESKMKPMTLNDLAAAFLILGVGLTLSCLLFLIERIYHKVFKGRAGNRVEPGSN